MDDGRLIDAGPEVAGRDAARSRSRARSCRSCAGTWSASPRPGTAAAWSSSARWAVGCAGPTSASSGTRPGKRSACPSCIFTTCGIPGTRWRRPTGASLRELMERMGHSSTRAALIYLHATRERDQAIAAGMGKLLSDARNTGRRHKSIGHATGTRPETRLLAGRSETADHAADLQPGPMRAGDGNRTRMTSLEGWGSTIELRPRNGDRTAGPAGPSGGSVPAPAPPGVTHAGPSAPPSGHRRFPDGRPGPAGTGSAR